MTLAPARSRDADTSAPQIRAVFRLLAASRLCDPVGDGLPVGGLSGRGPLERSGFPPGGRRGGRVIEVMRSSYGVNVDSKAVEGAERRPEACIAPGRMGCRSRAARPARPAGSG